MLDLSVLAEAVSRAKQRMATLEQELNEADARLGDGDTGGMLARVVDAMAGVDTAGQPDLGAAFIQMSRQTAAATGSSLGTLIATALRTVGKRAQGATAISPLEMAAHLDAALEDMMRRGGATLGDKTVLDGLAAIAAALRQDPPHPGAAARSAAGQALDAFRDQPCRIGRARMFSDRSSGLDDPGMLALERLVAAAVTPAPEKA